MKRVVNEYFRHLLCVFGGFWLGTQSHTAMYECWIKHSSHAVTKTLSSPVNHTWKWEQANAQATEAKLWFELQSLVYVWDRLVCLSGCICAVYLSRWIGSARVGPFTYLVIVYKLPWVDHPLLFPGSKCQQSCLHVSCKDARRDAWCMVHHTCFNHSVSQTPPRWGLLQHITEYTQLVI